jgi:streptomycin 3"-adenylyltransferase
MGHYGWHNCSGEVREQINRLLDGLRSDLAGNLIGVYLHGSLAAGCFNPLRSDLDLLVVTREPMMPEIKRRVAERLLAVSGQPHPIEISFLRHADLTPWRSPTPFDFHYGEDWRDTVARDLEDGAWRDWDAAQRRDADLAAHITVIHQRGICLWGAPIAEVFPTVPRDDFIASILGDVLDPKFGLNSDLAHPVYVILNACRTYAYLRTGQFLSKDEADIWALGALPARFHPTLAAALEAYRHQGDDRALAGEAVADLAGHLRVEIATLI